METSPKRKRLHPQESQWSTSHQFVKTPYANVYHLVTVTGVSHHAEPEIAVGDVNMADVARHAGVSIATVSRALRDVPGVSEPTRQRIRTIAQELSYVVSPEASGLARKSTGRLAVVTPRVDTWFYSTMVSSMQRTLSNAGQDMLLYQVEGEAQRRYFFEHLPSRRKADAVVLIALPLLAAEIERLDLLGADVVIAGGQLQSLPHVHVDDRAVGATAVEHLIGLGHRKIAIIRTSDTEGAVWSSDVMRAQGYADAMAAAGLEVPPDYVQIQPYGADSGANALSRLLDLAEPPTAVFAYSDEIGVSALRTLQLRGLSAPEDMSIISVDGHPLAELFGLTSIDQQVARQGTLAAEMAVVLGGRHTPPRRDVLVPTRLVVRSSTGPPRAGSARRD